MLSFLCETRSSHKKINAYFNWCQRVTKMNQPSKALCSNPSSLSIGLGQDLLLQPPAEVRGMKALDRELFSKIIVVPVLEVDVKEVTVLSKSGLLKKYLLKLYNFKPVQNKVSDLNTNLDLSSESRPSPPTRKLVHLNPLLIKSFSDLEEHDRDVLNSMGITQLAMHFVNLTVTYANWRPDEALKAILPEGTENVTGFSQIGHIIHLNLRDHVMEYKQIIGQILLDKVKGARTVVNKTNSISNTYRNFQMEIICGEHNMMTQVRENSCIYEFDFSSVYWNPRLCTEHERITKKVNEGDVLYDIFAGVGPFSIPACKKKCSVLANDLNPESYKWLQHNAKLNKVLPFLKAFNKDGREFLQEDVKSDILRRWKDEASVDKTIHITMNLPALAETFLSVFNGLFLPEEISSVNIKQSPIVHLYCFTKGAGDPAKMALNKVQEHLGSKIDEKDILEIIQVRTVSTNKEMMRVSFSLSLDILVSFPNANKQRSTEECPDGPLPKKLCLDENGEKVDLVDSIVAYLKWIRGSLLLIMVRTAVSCIN